MGNRSMEVPVWEDGSNERTAEDATFDEETDNSSAGEEGPGHPGATFDDDITSGSGITDPNKPSEGSSGKGKR